MVNIWLLAKKNRRKMSEICDVASYSLWQHFDVAQGFRGTVSFIMYKIDYLPHLFCFNLQSF